MRGQLPPRAFLYVGRLVEDKAIDVLAAAYRRYRAFAADPWPLIVAGTGPESRRLEAEPGVDLLGFVQPEQLPAVFARAGCLVLPSRLEPWAVVVHEAVSAGLPVVCTRACGASTRLVLDGYNGAIVSPDSDPGLAEALGRISNADDDDRRAMGARAARSACSTRRTAGRGVLLTRIPELRRSIGLADAVTTTG